MQNDVPPLEGAAALDPAAWERQGGELEFYGHLGEALESYAAAQRVRTAQGLAPDPHYGKLSGNLHARLGRDRAALECYCWAQAQNVAQGLALDPGLELNIGNCHQRLADYPAAEAAYAACAALLRAQGEEPGASLCKNRGALLIMQGQPEDALQLLDEAARLRAAGGQRVDVEITISRGAALRDLGRLAEANAALDEADEKTGGTSWPVAYHRARTLELEGKLFAAGQEGRRAQNLFSAQAVGDMSMPPDLNPLVERCFRTFK